MQSQQKQRRWLTPFYTLTLVMLPKLACADAIGNNQIASILNGLVSLLTSSIARIIFVLAIIGVGYGWLYLGQIPKGRAIGAIVGIGIVFSAGWIAQQLGVSAGG